MSRIDGSGAEVPTTSEIVVHVLKYAVEFSDELKVKMRGTKALNKTANKIKEAALLNNDLKMDARRKNHSKKSSHRQKGEKDDKENRSSFANPRRMYQGRQIGYTTVRRNQE